MPVKKSKNLVGALLQPDLWPVDFIYFSFCCIEFYCVISISFHPHFFAFIKYFHWVLHQ